MHAENVEECKQIQLNKATNTARYPQQHNTTYYDTPAKSDKFLNHSRHQKAQKTKTYDCMLSFGLTISHWFESSPFDRTISPLSSNNDFNET